jgi:uncharacterized protein
MTQREHDGIPVGERVAAELRVLRENVVGVYGSMVATSDGLLIAHDIPDMEPTRIAALVSTTLGLASQTTQATGRGPFREAVARGTDGYLAVYAAGRTAVVAVIGSGDLNIGMLHYEAREVISRVAALSAEFARWATPSSTGAAAGPGPSGPGGPGAPDGSAVSPR